MAGVYVCNNWCRGAHGEIKSRMGGGRERNRREREGERSDGGESGINERNRDM